MVFAVDTEERVLHAFADEAAAVAHCAGLDVESGHWLFWDGRGEPLEPVFTRPPTRGFFSSDDGEYHLSEASAALRDLHGPLEDVLGDVLRVEGTLDSVEAVRAHLRP